MGKSKKPKKAHKPQLSHHPYRKPTSKPPPSKTKPSPKSSTPSSKPNPNPKSNPHSRSQPSIPLPLSPHKKILLLGEGDFSFSASLVTHHAHTSGNLTATTFESPQSLAAKHPSTPTSTLPLLTAAGHKVLYNIDATKLGLPHTPHASSLSRARGTFDTCVFLFPHVGGKTTDVNRQVRANQALVVGFLEGAKRMLKPGGKVVVSVFEGAPYELWGVRNLARHVGLVVEASGRWEWERWPGYRHARTLGDLEGGWKGEERGARVYVFGKEGGGEEGGVGDGKGKEGDGGKGGKEDEGSEEDDSEGK